MKKIHEISVKNYKSDGFIKKYQELVHNVMIPYQYKVLKDEIDGVEKSGAIENFINAGKALRGEEHGSFYGMVFQDSDVAKWIEAAAYSVSVFQDKELEEKIDEVVDLVANAQDSDGYLDTRFTISQRERRWQNLLEAHELYCAGHMMEAACAYYEATGKRKLLDVAEKNAEHIYRHFITDKAEGYPGHPEIELALMKVYAVTGNKHCLELAKHFIDCRGVDPHYYEKEIKARDWYIWGNNPSDYAYQQSDTPLKRLSDAKGHAVRAGYLYSGMKDVATETDDKELSEACKRLWNSITQKRMYITGGIGSTCHGEAFSTDYDLPSDTVYAETCASIALMMFAERMLADEINGEYGDVMETAFYNTVLSGIQTDGKEFFYVNPLEAVPGISEVAQTQRHVRLTRFGWHACACCPPNAARLIASIGKYAYGEKDDTVFCNLYAAGEVSFKNGMKLYCKTEYPYSGEIRYKIEGNGNIAMRIPAWSKKYKAAKNGCELSVYNNNGYIIISAQNGDEITLTLDISPRYVYASEKVPALSGKASICAGPLVYCFEGVDNNDDVLSLRFDTNSLPHLNEYDEKLLCGTRTLTVAGFKREAQNSLYSDSVPALLKTDIHGIPYSLWANRGKNQMRVWLPVK
ncbi:MAG: glycoside hydrolase family 127 protein [Clostridia bacterium]|nr:glycoside hydrolase family 127 protein [Clostridia bacterium]